MKGIVWAYDRKSGIEKLREILLEYRTIGIDIQDFSRNPARPWVSLQNSDVWEIVSPSETARGKRANVSYVDGRIPKQVVNSIIRPATLLRPYQAITYYSGYTK
jgi:prepilin-type processing-associated H-X9-DG protein